MIDCNKINEPYEGRLVIVNEHHFGEAKVTTRQWRCEIDAELEKVLARTSWRALANLGRVPACHMLRIICHVTICHAIRGHPNLSSSYFLCYDSVFLEYIRQRQEVNMSIVNLTCQPHTEVLIVSGRRVRVNRGLSSPTWTKTK